MTVPNQAVVAEYLTAYNDGQLDHLRSLVTPTYVHHNGAQSLSFDDFCRGAAWIRRGMPDFRVLIQDQVADGDRVVVRFTGAGTHTGAFGAEAPSGQRVTVYGTTIYRLESGLIAEDWETMDEQPFRDLLAAP